MADDVVISIGVRQTGIEAASNAMQALESRVNKAFNAMQKGRITSKQFEKSLTEISGSIKGQAQLFRKNSDVVNEYATALRKAAAQKELAAKMEKEAKAAAKLERELESLRMEFKQGYAAQKQYDQTHARLERAFEEGIIDADRYGDAIQRLKMDFASFNAGTAKWTNQFVQGSARAGKGMNRLGMYAQQVGYQVGDFFVQVGSGQNVMVAFGQQATQLAGLLPGVAGAIIGIGISVATAIIVPMMKASGNLKKFTENVDDLETAMGKLKSALELQRGPLEDIRDMYGEISDEVAFLVDAQVRSAQRLVRVAADASLASAFDKDSIFKTWIGTDNDVTKAIRGIEEIDRVTKIYGDNLNAMGPHVGQTFSLMKSGFDRLPPAAKKAAQSIIDLRASTDAPLEEQRDLALEVVKALESLNDPKYAEQIEAITAFASHATEQLAKIETAADDARKSLQEMNAWNTGSAVLGVGLGSDSRAESEFPSWGAGRGAEQEKLLAEYKARIKALEDGKKGTSGGSLDGMINSYEKLMDRLNGVDPLITKFNTEVKNLDKWLQAGAISQEQYNAAVGGLRKELEANLDPLEKFRKGLEDALDPDKAYIKGLEALNQSLSDFLFDPFDKGLKGMVAGFAEALRRMASDALAAQLMKYIFPTGGGGFGGGIMGMFGFNANGNVFQGGNQVTAFANGGIVNGPTMFPMANGAGIMGEAGPEAVMPLKRTSSGKLGVETSGGSSEPTSIKVINVDDRASIGKYLSSPAGEKIVLNVLRRNGIGR